MKHLVSSTIALLLLAAGTNVSGQNKQPGTPVDKVTAALPESAPAKPKQPRKLLIFSRTKGYRHSSIGIGAKAIAMMGDKTGAYTAFHTEDPSFFEPEKLKAFDAVFMLNTTGDCLKPDVPKLKKGATPEEKAAYEKAVTKANEDEAKYKKSLHDFVAGGKGLIGVHSATDTYHGWKDYNMMMGGTFAGHPWHTKVPIKNLAPKSPINAAFDGKDFEITDEIYQFRGDTALPTDRKFLLSLDTKVMNVKAGKRKDGLYPVSWIANYGKGRTFYCSLGHRDEIFWNPMILKHYLAGIQFALGDLPADATPTASAGK